jgi:hypothetical protein
LAILKKTYISYWGKDAGIEAGHEQAKYDYLHHAGNGVRYVMHTALMGKVNGFAYGIFIAERKGVFTWKLNV